MGKAAGEVSGRLVALVLASSTGGIGRHVGALVDGLVEAGDTVLVCGPGETERQFGFTGRGAAFAPVEISAGPHPGDLVAVRALRSALRAHRPDLVHAHGLRAGLVAALARPDRCPLVVTWHNPAPGDGVRGRVYRWLERYVARSADVTLGASADLVARAREVGARDARLGAVGAPRLPAPTRSRAEVRAELVAGTDRPLVLSVGRLHPQKGYPVLVSAAARWRTRTPVPLVAIAGTGPAYMSLAAQVSQERAPVVLLGHRNDVADLLAAADLAVVTSVWEARQLFAQEALAAGVPLIATDVGGLPDLVGDAAVLVPAGSVDAVDEAVRRLLDDPTLRAMYARRGIERSAGWPTAGDTVTELRAVYAELLGRERPAEQPAPGRGKR